MGIEIRLHDDLGGSGVTAALALELYGLVLHDELRPFEHGPAGDYLVCEGHLLLAEIGQVADAQRHAVHPDHLVLLELLQYRIDQGGHN